MCEKEGKITKQDILKKIEAMLNEDTDLDAKSVFARIENLLEPDNKAESFTSGDIGYVQIDEKLQAEYLEWEENIKQEWLEAIESIRKGIRKK